MSSLRRAFRRAFQPSHLFLQTNVWTCKVQGLRWKVIATVFVDLSPTVRLEFGARRLRHPTLRAALLREQLEMACWALGRAVNIHLNKYQGRWRRCWVCWTRCGGSAMGSAMFRVGSLLSLELALSFLSK